MLDATTTTPRYATLAGWRELTGMSRSATYRALAAGHLSAVKRGANTLIDVEAGLAWLASLPRASFGSGDKAA